MMNQITTLDSRALQQRTREEAAAITTSILVRASGIVVASPEEYQAADAVLARLRDKRKLVMAGIEKLKAPINQAHDEVMRLEHELVDPLVAAEKSVKGKMASWQVGEQRRVREEQEAARRERERVEGEQRRVQEEAARMQSLGKISKAQMLRHEALGLSEQMEEMAAAPSAQATVASGSTARVVKRWRVGEMRDLLQGILDGIVPEGVVIVDKVRVNQYMNGDPSGEVVGGWPGMEVYDDVEIRGRG